MTFFSGLILWSKISWISGMLLFASLKLKLYLFGFLLLFFTFMFGRRSQNNCYLFCNFDLQSYWNSSHFEVKLVNVWWTPQFWPLVDLQAGRTLSCRFGGDVSSIEILVPPLVAMSVVRNISTATGGNVSSIEILVPPLVAMSVV